MTAATEGMFGRRRRLRTATGANNRVDWRWLPLAILLVLDLGVASGSLLRGACSWVTGWFAVGGGHTVPSIGECSVEQRFEARDPSGALRHVDPQARLRALQESWRDGAFRCFYTDVALVDDSSRARDHRYLVFDHRTPGDEGSVVVTCALVNRMKTDLTEEQFKVMVTELAKVFAGGAFDECAFPEGVAP